ncbi:DUF3152 domain-containing protein [Krasilnikovia sp. MM14-A1004]|uniref:DUF3152 domain-containing protein n=1 Tax=Krasilnikovia sp. MM14-A1004 TaxID=3373541 RepID=UPI00399CCEFD
MNPAVDPPAALRPDEDGAPERAVSEHSARAIAATRPNPRASVTAEVPDEASESRPRRRRATADAVSADASARHHRVENPVEDALAWVTEPRPRRRREGESGRRRRSTVAPPAAEDAPPSAGGPPGPSAASPYAQEATGSRRRRSGAGFRSDVAAAEHRRGAMDAGESGWGDTPPGDDPEETVRGEADRPRSRRRRTQPDDTGGAAWGGLSGEGPGEARKGRGRARRGSAAGSPDLTAPLAGSRRRSAPDDLDAQRNAIAARAAARRRPTAAAAARATAPGAAAQKTGPLTPELAAALLRTQEAVNRAAMTDRTIAHRPHPAEVHEVHEVHDVREAQTAAENDVAAWVDMLIGTVNRPEESQPASLWPDGPEDDLDTMPGDTVPGEHSWDLSTIEGLADAREAFWPPIVVGPAPAEPMVAEPPAAGTRARDSAATAADTSVSGATEAAEAQPWDLEAALSTAAQPQDVEPAPEAQLPDAETVPGAPPEDTEPVPGAEAHPQETATVQGAAAHPRETEPVLKAEAHPRETEPVLKAEAHPQETETVPGAAAHPQDGETGASAEVQTPDSAEVTEAAGMRTGAAGAEAETRDTGEPAEAVEPEEPAADTLRPAAQAAAAATLASAAAAGAEAAAASSAEGATLADAGKAPEPAPADADTVEVTRSQREAATAGHLAATGAAATATGIAAAPPDSELPPPGAESVRPSAAMPGDLAAMPGDLAAMPGGLAAAGGLAAGAPPLAPDEGPILLPGVAGAPPEQGAPQTERSPANRRRLWAALLALLTVAVLIGGIIWLVRRDPLAARRTVGHTPSAAPVTPQEQPAGTGPAAGAAPAPAPTVATKPSAAAPTTAAPNTAAPTSGAGAAPPDEAQQAPSGAQPAGSFQYATGYGPVLGTKGTMRTFHVAVEKYLAQGDGGLVGNGPDASAFAADVDNILGDPRSWVAGNKVRFQRAPHGEPAEFTIYLASPDTSEEMCAKGGLETKGYSSCRLPGQVVINSERWREAVPHYDAPLDVYRAYVINHEVGHQLGHGHEQCPGKGKPAPVMLWQTYSLEGCTAYGWPYRNGKRYAGPPAV